MQAVAVRPYLPADELYHVGYAASLLEGRLPTLTTPLPGDRVPLMPDLLGAVAGMLDAAGARPPWLLLRLAGAALLAALALLALALGLGLFRVDRATGPAEADRVAGGAGPGDPAPGVAQAPPAVPRVSSRA